MIAILAIAEANTLFLFGIAAELRGAPAIRTICFSFALLFFVLSFSKRARS